MIVVYLNTFGKRFKTARAAVELGNPVSLDKATRQLFDIADHFVVECQ